MSRVMEAWEQVLREAISTDYDNQQLALLQIAFVLQRHNPYVMIDSDAPEKVLTRELIRLSLNEQRQKDTIDYLVRLVETRPQDADSLLYALSNAQPKLLAKPLLRLLSDRGATLKAAAKFQAVTAIEGLLKQDDEAIISALDEHDQIIELLDDWSESNDVIVADKADILADKIIDLLADNTEETD